MQEYNWIDMMNKMQELRLFCSLTVRGAKRGADIGAGTGSAVESGSVEGSADAAGVQHFYGTEKIGGKQTASGTYRKKTSGKDTQRRGPQKLYDSRDGSRTRGASADVSVLSGPIYRLRQEMGEENFRQLTELIRQGSEIMKKKRTITIREGFI